MLPEKNHTSGASASVEYNGHKYNIPPDANIGTVWPCTCCPPDKQVKVMQYIDGDLVRHWDTPSDCSLWSDEEERGTPQSGLVKLSKGESVDFRFAAANADALLDLLAARRVARHWWYAGACIVCPQHTREELLPKAERGRECPLCALGDDLPDRGKRAVEWHIPILEQARERNKTVRVHNANIRLLRINQRTFESLVGPVQSLADGGVNACEWVWRMARRNDAYGTYDLERTEERCQSVTQTYALPPLQLSLEPHSTLQEFAETLRIGGNLVPSPGRVEKWRTVCGAQLVACIWGRKKPLMSGYMDSARVCQWQTDDNYRSRLEESNIALRLTPPHVAIDLDRNQDVERFLGLNPWARKSMRIIGGRGCKLPVRLTGEYPAQVLNAFDPSEPDVIKRHRGEFRGNGLAIVDGLHPSGVLYRIENFGTVPEIRYSDIVWPPGWTLEKVHLAREFHESDDEQVEGGLLDTAKLKNVRQHPTKDGAVTAQCPACAAAGSDASGNHLIIYPDGRYGCAVHTDDPEHRSEIFRLASRDELRVQREARKREREVIAQLASVSEPIAYARQRKKLANELSLKESDVDKAVAAQRKEHQQGDGQGQLMRFENIEPWPEPVSLDETLRRVVNNVHDLLKVSDEGVVVLSLWVAFTHCYDSFDFSPILHLKSPEKRCGKSRALDFLKRMVCRPLKTSNASGAALFRAIEQWRPTCLIDEYDSVCSRESDQAEALRNILNSGFERGSPCLRCCGENFEPRVFDVYGPKAVASIGALPDTASDRAIVIPMKRKMRKEKVKRLRGFTEAEELRRKLTRWARDHAEALRDARPQMPAALDDRAADIWEPLVAIADLCGGDWPEFVRWAAETMSGQRESSETLTQRLLRDIRSVFNKDETERIETNALLLALEHMDDSPWSSFCRGKPLHAHRLGRMLAEFGIVHRRWQSTRGASPRGFYREDFADAWARYLT